MMRVNAPTPLWRSWAPVAAAALSLVLGACATTGQATAGQRPGSLAAEGASAPAYGYGVSRYRVGAPYQANGLWFVPADQPNYQDTGVAAVYTPATSQTADGERFNGLALTAAHATLPMPSIVEVTNLETGKRIEVRVNDRGATQPGRVIELSRGAADQLGFAGKGTAKVKVRYLRPAPIDAAPRTYAAAPVQPVQPAPVAAARPPVTAQPIQPALGGYAVQAGAFSDRANAERVVARLASAGGAAIRPLERGGVQLYRVVVGPWANEAQASAAREQVAALGFGDAKVVKF
jgi:rare lipoprotein A